MRLPAPSAARRLAGPLLAALFLTIAGCGGEPASGSGDKPGSSTGQAKPLTAQAILAKTAEVYSAAKSYADSGDLYFSAVKDGEKHTDDPRPLSVTLQRPNKLRMHMFGATVVSDGEKVLAWVEHLPGQALQLAAPKRLVPDTLLSDDHLRFSMNAGLEEIVSPQLDLLLGPIPWRQAAERAVLLDEATVDEHACYRVEVPLAEGSRIYWIDKESFLLRRMDLPAASLKSKLDPDGQFSAIEAWIELKGAQIDREIDPKAFQVELPRETRLVRRFVSPISDPPLRVGDVVGDFTFTDLDGNEVTRATLGEKIVVVDFWFIQSDASRESLPALEEVYQRFKDDDRVAFLAVSVDLEQVGDEAVRAHLAGLGVTIPALRDRTQQYETVFQEPRPPATFLLGPDGKIHGFRVGYNPTHAGLAESIERLLEGKDVAQQTLDFYAAEKRAYEVELSAASVEVGSQLVEILRSDVAPVSQPSSFSMSKLWTCDELEKPGNLFLVEADEEQPPRIFVHDGWRAVAEVDVEGKVLARHDLELPERAVVSYLRIARDGEGKLYFVAAAARQQQLFLFDEHFKLLLSFPDGPHEGIGDVQLSDMNGDGRLQMVVGYWGVVGLQLVNLDGERAWSNRNMENVLQVAVTKRGESHEKEILCVTTRGTLLPVDAQGIHSADLRVANRAITHLVVSDFDADGRPERCALAAVPGRQGAAVAVGLDEAGTELWSYDLPEGYHEHPVERIVPVRLSADDGGWLLPAADGSIHMLTPAGQLVDRFNYGSALTGLALTQWEFPLLLVSSTDGLTAWKIERGAE